MKLANWDTQGRSIDRFLEKYAGGKTIKYRFWEGDVLGMTYLSIRFPAKYQENKSYHLHDILAEKDGVKFSLILMKQIMDTQIIHENSN